MAEDSSHRLRWLVLALLLAGAVYLIRSRRPVPELAEVPPWQPPRLADGRDQPVRSAPIPAAEPRAAAGTPAQTRSAPRPRRTATAEIPPGAAAALPDGSPPGPEYTVKAKAGSTLFHGPDSPYFGRTRAEFWFRTAADARAAGLTEWTPARRRGTD